MLIVNILANNNLRDLIFGYVMAANQYDHYVSKISKQLTGFF